MSFGAREKLSVYQVNVRKNLHGIVRTDYRILTEDNLRTLVKVTVRRKLNETLSFLAVELESRPGT